MVSLVIILFLVAVLVSLFVGRIAEILIGKMQERVSQHKIEEQPVATAHHAVSRKAG
jgi:transaldolase